MKKTPIIIVSTLVVVVALIAIVAASGGKKDSSMGTNNNMTGDTTASAAATNAVMADKVVISNYKYGPEDIKVKVGTTVTWTNNDAVKHNVVSDDGKMPEGKLMAKGETYSYTFDKVGTFKYHCDPHPYMHGSVTVE